MSSGLTSLPALGATIILEARNSLYVLTSSPPAAPQPAGTAPAYPIPAASPCPQQSPPQSTSPVRARSEPPSAAPPERVSRRHLPQLRLRCESDVPSRAHVVQLACPRWTFPGSPEFGRIALPRS